MKAKLTFLLVFVFCVAFVPQLMADSIFAQVFVTGDSYDEDSKSATIGLVPVTLNLSIYRNAAFNGWAYAGYYVKVQHQSGYTSDSMRDGDSSKQTTINNVTEANVWVQASNVGANPSGQVIPSAKADWTY